MDWKDTVIHADGCTTNLGIIGATCNCGAERQAEITWDIAFKAGIGKVVDSLDWENTPYQTHGRSPIIQIQISEAEWRDKLREWGLN